MNNIAYFESSVPVERIDSLILKLEAEEGLFIQFSVAGILVAVDVQLGTPVGISQGKADGSVEGTSEIDVVIT